MPEDLQPAEIEWRKRHEKFLEELAELLPPCVADEVNIKLQIKSLLEVEEKLRLSEKEKEKILIENDRKIKELSRKTEELLDKVEKQQRENRELITQIKALRSEVKQQQKNNSVMSFIDGLFKKGKR
jgi:predicted RNase H-like nuclease (RuvC/YqgF family)